MSARFTRLVHEIIAQGNGEISENEALIAANQIDSAYARTEQEIIEAARDAVEEYRICKEVESYREA